MPSESFDHFRGIHAATVCPLLDDGGIDDFLRKRMGLNGEGGRPRENRPSHTAPPYGPT